MGAARDSRTLKLAAIGTAGGLFSGLFGVGGGAVMVPLLLLWLAYEERAAAATSLGTIAIVSVFAAGAQAIYGNVDVGDALLVGIPAVGGVLLGTLAAAARPRRRDRVRLRPAAGRGGGPAGADVVILAALIGVMAGVASGLLGIGGGILFVPALTIVLGHGQVEAEATSLLAIVPVALVGSWRQRVYGNLRLHDAAVMGALSVARRARRRRAGERAAGARPADRLRIAAAEHGAPARAARRGRTPQTARRLSRRAQVRPRAAD